jgi:hypothetical protein
MSTPHVPFNDKCTGKGLFCKDSRNKSLSPSGMRDRGGAALANVNNYFLAMIVIFDYFVKMAGDFPDNITKKYEERVRRW